MGWYGMASVDVLDFFPKTHIKRLQLGNMLSIYTEAVKNTQHIQNGLWYQVMDKKDSFGNYPEASASCMFVYTLAKGF
jgi:unsaturated rhamnogalacturonyl hydrolase